MKLKEADFTIFDVETTGLYPYSGDKICEIAAIRTTLRNKAPKKFHALVDPERPISYGAFSVNGITEEMVRGKPTIEEILPDFIRFIEGSVLVAYNAGFDLGFLECALGDRKSILYDYHVIDALKLARVLFPAIGRYNLANVSRSLGIRAMGEHRALADAVMTYKVFEKELELIMKDGASEVEDMFRVQVTKTKSIKTVKDYKIRLIEEAIREQRKLNITYRSLWSNKITSRTITPRQLRQGYDKHYLIAHCHLRNEERNFRLDCIIDAKDAREGAG